MLQYFSRRKASPSFPRTELSTAELFNDALVPRIRSSYLASIAALDDGVDAMWTNINVLKRDVHDALARDDDTLKKILTRPSDCNLFWGFENACVDVNKTIKDPSTGGAQVIEWLSRLCEAVAGQRLTNPELHKVQGTTPVLGTQDRLLDLIETAIGQRLSFPNPFPGEYGVQTRAGLVSYRAIQAVYQTWRLKQLSLIYGPRIVEIGAGLGRTAFFAKEMGLHDYTIVDLPMTSVAQAAFLGSVVGPEMVRLPHEPLPAHQALKIMTPEEFFAGDRRYDIAFNADSLPEMPRSVADRYAAFCKSNCKAFLSINHEVGRFVVRQLAAFSDMPTSRFPYWMRDGYVEELFVTSAD